MKLMASVVSQPIRAALASLPLSLATAFFLGCPSAGAADTTPPTVSITRPAAGAVVTNGSLTVAGTAHDNVGVANVNYSLNHSDFATANSTNNWTNWSAVVGLTPGTNNLRVYAADAAGNHSTTNGVTFVYILKAVMTVQKTGEGTFNNNYNGVMLNVGQSYSITATASPGFVFTGWSGGVNSTNATISFVMQEGLVIVANFSDTVRPTVTITRPSPGESVTNGNFTIAGTANDNFHLANVNYSLNHGGFTTANSTNGWTNWSAVVGLTPGTNDVRVYATDSAGHASLTNGVTFFYVVKATATFAKYGKGTFSTNYNNVPLPIGQRFSVTATPLPGFVFSGWSGSASTTNPTLTFIMQPGLNFVANFQDVAAPTVTITRPVPGQQVADQNYLLMGRASDNLAVSSVFYQLNGGGWIPAQTFNNNMNWMASVTLNKGSNFVQAFATDTTGHFSHTNGVSFTYVPPRTWAPDSIQGVLAEVTPNSSAAFRMVFGVSTFSESAFGAASFNGVGDYTYKKLTTNTAELTISFTQPPPAVTTSNVIALTFGGVDSATYTDLTVGGDYGVLNLFSTPTLAPISLTNTTIHATNTASATGIALTLTNNVFLQKDSNGDKHSGNYTYQKFSPAVGMLILAYSAPDAENGATNYIQLTYTEAGGGNYAVTSFSAQGLFTGTSSGTFTTP